MRYDFTIANFDGKPLERYPDSKIATIHRYAILISTIVSEIYAV